MTCPRLVTGMSVLQLRNTCTYPYEKNVRCKTHPCLLRKQLHCPHSNDMQLITLVAPPRGVHPKPLKEGERGGLYCVAGAFFTFSFNEGAFTPEYVRFR